MVHVRPRGWNYGCTMELMFAATDWAVLGTWAGVVIALAALIIGTLLQLRKRHANSDLRQHQQGGANSENYQAGRDVTLNDRQKRRRP